MVVILAAVLIRAPAEMRRRGEVERANQQLRDEIAERKKIEAELRSVDHRGPRRPNVGGAEQRVRRDFRVHAALGLNPSAQIRARAEMLARTGAQSTSRRCSHDETAGTLVAMRSVDGDRAVPVFD